MSSWTRRGAKQASCAAVAAIAAMVPAGRAIAADPVPQQRPSAWVGTLTPAKPSRGAAPVALKQALVRFRSAPFPFDGLVPDTRQPFLDARLDARVGRQSARINGIYWADETYSDDRVLLGVPQRFRFSDPGVIVVFLHGNAATLERDVARRQRVPQQIAASGVNAVLVAPQLAFDAWDSSAGNFWEAGAFARFIAEASGELARLSGRAQARRAFEAMPVVLIAYSGGYLPLAWILHHGGAMGRIAGVVVLDGLYGEVDKFARFIETARGAFFVSAYTQSTQERNLELARRLGADGIETRMGLGVDLPRGTATFIEAEPGVTHADFVSMAWVEDPLADILRRIALPRTKAGRR